MKLICLTMTFVLTMFANETQQQNQAPFFNPPLKSTYFFSEHNLTRPGDILLSLQVSDIDDNEFDFGVLGEFYQKLIKIQKVTPNKADVILRQVFDREVQEKYENVTFFVRDQPGNTVYQTIRFVILDIDDNKPVFVNAPYKVDVPESMKVGSTIYSLVSAFDIDGPLYREFKFTLLENTHFAIHTFPISNGRYNGSIKLLKELDYETKRQYTLQIIAKSVNSNLQSISELVVNVTDSPDQAPIFLQSPYYIKIAEEMSIGEEILKISARDGDLGINTPCMYDILPSSYSKYFSIDKQTGILSISERIDREINDLLEFQVVAYEKDDKDSREQVQVTIVIMDLNDNIPKFNRNLYNLTINENALSGMKLNLLQGDVINVFDPDKDINGTFTLTLHGINDDFEIYPKSALNSADLDIRVKEKNNLKSRAGLSDHYTLKARDIGIEGKETQVDLYIKIEAMNEFAPKFDQDIYTFKLNENSEYNTTVGHVYAFDGDAQKGVFSDISYSLKNGQARFEIDNKTGRIYTIANTPSLMLDRETQDMFYLSVDAQDDGDLKSNAKIIIKLTDANDNPPNFVFSHDNFYRGFIDENSNEWLEKIRLQAIDDDLGVNSDVSFEIVGGLFKEKFTINETTNSIELLRGETLDFEEIRERHETNPFFEDHLKQDEVMLSLVILVRNIVPPFYSSKTYARIIVKDVNDNMPKFEQSSYSTSLQETRSNGAVIQVKAYDLDAQNTPNSKVNYQIVRGGKEKFMIDSFTGALSLLPNANIDRDLFGYNYTLEIQATDFGPSNNIKGDICQVFIEVIDVNNKNPKFNFAERLINVYEDILSGSTIFTAIADDMDTNSNIKYSLQIYNENFKNCLKIDQKTGEISVQEMLDREKTNKIDLLIKAEDLNADKMFRPQLALLNFTINILDINDNSPIFVGNATYDESTQTFIQYESVRENIKIGTLVARIKVTDADEKSNITLEMLNRQTFFYLDELSGDIFVANHIDFESMESLVNLTIAAIDNVNGTIRESSLKLTFEIEDVNDNAPIFTKILFFEHNQELAVSNQTTLIRIRKNTKIGSEILQINATDADSAENGALNFSILKNRAKESKNFDINPKNGTIYLISSIHKESQLIQIIDVIASDNGQPSLSSRHTIKFILVDEDNNAVVFKKRELCGIIGCNQNNQSLVVSIQEEQLNKTLGPFKFARMIDESKSEQDICYFIVSGDSKTFSIDKKTAYISANERIDREKRELYEVLLKATENCQAEPKHDKPYDPFDMSTILIQIQIVDINDNRPFFEHSFYQIGLLPDLIFSDKILEGFAFDHDIKSNLKFQLATGDASNNTDSKNFKIDFDETKANPNGTRYSSFRLKSETYFKSSANKNTYFNLQLNVYDEDNHTDSAKIQIYVLNKQQILNFIIASNIDHVKEIRDELQHYINNLTGYRSNVDMILQHRNEKNLSSSSGGRHLTDVIIHFVNNSTNSTKETIEIISATEIIRIIDDLRDLDLINKYRVVAVKQFNSHSTTSMLILDQNGYVDNDGFDEQLLSNPTKNYPFMIVKLVCAISLSLFTFVTIFIIIICCFIHQKYKRKLKTERAIAKTFHQRPDDDLHKSFFNNIAFESSSIPNIPGTNLYSYEGSNPMWLKKYENLKNSSLSHSSSSDAINKDEISSFYLKQNDGKEDDVNLNVINSFNKQIKEKLESRVYQMRQQEQNDLNARNKEEYADLYVVESTVI